MLLSVIIIAGISKNANRFNYSVQFCVLVDTGSANLAIAGRDDANINDWFRTEK